MCSTPHRAGISRWRKVLRKYMKINGPGISLAFSFSFLYIFICFARARRINNINDDPVAATSVCACPVTGWAESETGEKVRGRTRHATIFRCVIGGPVRGH